MSNSFLCFSFSFSSRSQYSSADSRSWMEHGPMMTRSRLFVSLPLTTSSDSVRPSSTVFFDSGVCAISCWRRPGGVSGLYPRTGAAALAIGSGRLLFVSTYFASPRSRPCCPHSCFQCERTARKRSKPRRRGARVSGNAMKILTAMLGIVNYRCGPGNGKMGQGRRAFLSWGGNWEESSCSYKCGDWSDVA